MSRFGVLAALAAAASLLAACETLPPLGTAEGFTYYGAGDLKPGSGTGVRDRTVYAPGIKFPVSSYPAYLNSQVWGVGGSNGAAGAGYCDAANFQMPWRDNFCEARSGANRETLNCPSKAVHQGQDIRAGDAALCNAIRTTPRASRTQVPIVAVEDGYISYIGSYTVNLRAADHIYRYMHMNMERLQVAEGDQVRAGEVIGYLSNDFGGTPTTVHLHMEFQQNIDGVGFTWVSPYMSLVRAYERQLRGRGVEVSD